ncbi:MAG: hypothetical protein N7Q72_07340, partial [Spiroplasma sp. Tabriz.8]|nr:hypothetical protein [Spiroplasma sp. Tabriz.8]
DLFWFVNYIYWISINHMNINLKYFIIIIIIIIIIFLIYYLMYITTLLFQILFRTWLGFP